jgi:hypothetical protein
VNFRQPGMLDATPAAVVSFLARRHELPYLTGVTVVLVGLGDTAAPQIPLSISEQNNVVAIWSAIAKAGGATLVRIDPAPLSGRAPAHVPAVSLVRVPRAIPFRKIRGVRVAPGGGGYTLSDALRDFAVGSAALTSTAKAALIRVAARYRSPRARQDHHMQGQHRWHWNRRLRPSPLQEAGDHGLQLPCPPGHQSAPAPHVGGRQGDPHCCQPEPAAGHHHHRSAR